jgi:hypothetical protein
MFPQPHYAPSPLSQLEINASVAAPIPDDLAFPVFLIGAGHPAMRRATMPETAIDKDDDPRAWEREVGFAREGQVSTPPLDLMASEDADEYTLGHLVAGRPHRGHDLGALSG